MQKPVGLGLSTFDRALFGFKKADRSLATPSPSPTPDHGALLRDDTEAPPELPPLGMLNGNNSFANLLNQLDKPTQSETNPSSGSTSSGPATPTARARITSSPRFLPLTECNGKTNPSMGHMSSITNASRFSKSARSPGGTLPERQQSSSTTASGSKRSDGSSTCSMSSRSSVEEEPLKPIPLPSLDSVFIPSLDVDFFASEFPDLKLSFELTTESANVTPVSSPNMNKPLPHAPSGTSHRRSIAELDSAPVKQTTCEAIVPRDAAILSDRIPEAPRLSQPPSQPAILSFSASVSAPSPTISHTLLTTSSLNTNQNIASRKRVFTNEHILLNTMRQLATISDLRAMALVNKGFYRNFKRNESEVVERVLANESPQAWELRQLVRGEQRRTPFQMKAIQRDVAALRALQAFMMLKCAKFCRRRTLDGLTGNDPQKRAEIENALWKIWTFCKIFGKGASRDARQHAQISWLQGKPVRDRADKSSSRIPTSTKPMSRSELEDMSEMWRCMEALLSGFRGREMEAREAGIFDQCRIDGQNGHTETHYLEDWICDILSVGPKAVLTMISCSFEHAQVLGVTKWTPPGQEKNRRTFLKAALEQVYRDRLVEEARLEAEKLARSAQRLTADSRRFSESHPPVKKATNVPRTVLRSTSDQTPAQLDEKRPVSQGLEIRPDCDPEANIPDIQRTSPNVSPVTNSASFSSLAMMSNASTRLGATLFPIQRDRVSSSTMHSPMQPQHDFEDPSDQDIAPRVVDPIDRALALLVKQLGFPGPLAKQALAMSDDGAGIDVQRAIELLSSDRRLEPLAKEVPLAELPGTDPIIRNTPGTNEYCEGTSRRVSVLQRRRSNLRGFISRHSFRQNFPLTAILDREDEDSAIHQLAKLTIMPKIPVSGTSIQQSSTDKKAGHHNLTNFIKYRNSVRLNHDLNSRDSFMKGHKKSSSTGTIDFTEDTSNDSVSPVSPLTPMSGLGGFVAIRPLSQQVCESGNGTTLQTQSRPKVTLTRVGTGRRPNRMISLRHSETTNAGGPPEIIGYTY